VPSYKLFPGQPFAPETSLYQLGVGIQAFSASRIASLSSLTMKNAK
jgi:hypothetical protein